jgi:phage-related tail protein
MRNYKIWLLALGVATVFTAIMLVNQNTVRTEQKLNEQIKRLEHKTKAEQNAEVENLKKQIQELDTKLQSKAAEKARLARIEADRASLAQKVVNSAIPTAQASGGSENEAKMFIYMRESGNNPNAVNRTSGACGLAQALPCGKMNCALGDYACQDAWATSYMQSRYGTWVNAKAFWLAHHWW